jgi:hypothetical protein
MTGTKERRETSHDHLGLVFIMGNERVRAQPSHPD